MTRQSAPARQEPFDGEVDVATERATCRLLLGDMRGAEAALGLPRRGGKAPAAPDPNILAFVQVAYWKM